MIFQNGVHDFLDKIKKRKISKKKRKQLYDFIVSLEDRTEKQKERFLLYYGLIPNNENLKGNYTEIGKKYICKPTAIKCSVVSVVSNIATIEGEKKQILKNIIESK